MNALDMREREGDPGIRLRATEPLYVLWLVRDGRADSKEQLIAYFRARGAAMSVTNGYLVDRAVDELVREGFLELAPDGKLRVTDFVRKVQTTLGLSIAELATAPPGSFPVSPVFGQPVDAADARKYSHDIFVLMPFSDNLKPIYERHLRNVAKAWA